MPVRLFLSSGDLVADRRFDFARDLQLKGDLVAAADLLLQATELAPGFASAWFTLGGIREQLGEREAAISAFRKARVADPEDRHGASLRLTLLGAEPLSAMPRAYVRALFDQYAPKFDAALLNDLGYRGPALLFKAVLAARRFYSRPCWRPASRSESPPSSSAPSISVAARDWRPPPSPGMSIISSASICRRAWSRRRGPPGFMRSSRSPRWWRPCAASPTPALISFSPPTRWSICPISRRCCVKWNACLRPAASWHSRWKRMAATTSFSARAC